LAKDNNAREVRDAPLTHVDAGRDSGRLAGKVTALGLFLVFARIGLTSFGGGLSGWFMREFVHDRHWLSEEEFLNGLALSQALPGVNIKNLAIWIGYRLLGWRGAVAGFSGIIFPPAIFIVLLGVFFSAIASRRSGRGRDRSVFIHGDYCCTQTAATVLSLSRAGRDLRGSRAIQGVAGVDRADSRCSERRIRIRSFVEAALTTVDQLQESHIKCPDRSSHYFRFLRHCRS
jgi:hypothetical protein